MEILCMKLAPDAVIPSQAHEGDAGYDLCSVEEYVLQPQERKVFLTHIALAIPVGWYGRIAPRSGLAAKHGIDVLAGIIDAGYRGDIGVVLLNTGNEPVHIFAGMKIAQLIIHSCAQVHFRDVSALDDTVRNTDGWGSSG